MSLDNIHLPSLVLNELYSKSIVLLESDEAIEAITKSIPLKTIGANNRRITILVKYVDIEYLPESSLDFLKDVLAACNLSVSDIAILNISAINAPEYREIIKSLKSQKLILIGISTVEIKLPFTVPNFQLQNFDNRDYLICPTLEEIMQDKILKKDLWNALKRLFEISRI